MEGAFARQGFLFENFDPRDGKGLGAHPFTGWTSPLNPVVLSTKERC